MDVPFRKALVTGGAGFIGSHLADALVESGVEVVVVDNLATGHRDNLDRIADRITFLEGDIRDRNLMDRAAEGCEVVFHQAAVVSVPQTVADPVTSAEVNELGTLAVLEAARAKKARRVVLASSSAVYGDDPEMPKRESQRPKPLSPYAVQKLAGEYYAGLYAGLYGLETVCLRYFNVFGPRQDPSSPYSGVISIFMAKSAAGEAPSIHGNGEQYRDFVYVADVVAANLLSAVREGAAGGVFNVGTGRSITINRLWETVRDLSGISLAPAHGPPRAGDIVASVSSIDHARQVLGFSPRFTFEEGLRKTHNWYREGR